MQTPAKPQHRSSPFNGQIMTCCICGAQQQHDPQVQSRWRCVEVNREPYFACPFEFPLDEDRADAEEFREAWQTVFAAIAFLRAQPPPGDGEDRVTYVLADRELASEVGPMRAVIIALRTRRAARGAAALEKGAVQ